MNAEVEYRHAIGAYLLGALEAGEARRLEEHIQTCEPCRGELLELGGAVADLALVAPARPDAAFAGSRAAGTSSTGIPAQRVPAAGSRRQLLALAAAAAAVVAAGVSGFAFGTGSGDTFPVAAPTTAPTTRPPGARTVQGSSQVAVTGRAELVPTSWGTSIEITMSGLQRAVGPGVECMLVVVSTSGTRGTIGSWVVPPKPPTPAGERFKVPTAVPLGELARLLVVAEDGTEVLIVKI